MNQVVLVPEMGRDSTAGTEFQYPRDLFSIANRSRHPRPPQLRLHFRKHFPSCCWNPRPILSKPCLSCVFSISRSQSRNLPRPTNKCWKLRRQRHEIEKVEKFCEKTRNIISCFLIPFAAVGPPFLYLFFIAAKDIAPSSSDPSSW